MRSASRARERRLAVLESKIERERSVLGAHDRRLAEVPATHVQKPAVLRPNFRDDGLPTSADDGPPRLREHPPESADADAGHRAADDERPKRRDATAREQQLSSSPPPELIAVSPRRELRPQRLTDPNERQPVAQLGEPDVVGRDAPARVAVELLRVLDRFPALFERRKVPALALRADDPKPPFGGIERESLADRKRLDRSRWCPATCCRTDTSSTYRLECA